MSDMRAKLDSGLKEAARGVEEQERTIECVLLMRVKSRKSTLIFMVRILVELDQSDEPAWTYLDYQHAHILSTMKIIYEKAQESARSLSSISLRMNQTDVTVAAEQECTREPSSSTAYLNLLTQQLSSPQYQLNSLARELAYHLTWSEIRHSIFRSEHGRCSLAGYPLPREAAFRVRNKVIRGLLEDRQSVHGWKIQKGKRFPQTGAGAITDSSVA